MLQGALPKRKKRATHLVEARAGNDEGDALEVWILPLAARDLLHGEREDARTVVLVLDPLGVKVGRHRVDDEAQVRLGLGDALVVLAHHRLGLGDVDARRLVLAAVLQEGESVRRLVLTRLGSTRREGGSRGR